MDPAQTARRNLRVMLALLVEEDGIAVATVMTWGRRSHGLCNALRNRRKDLRC